MSEHFKPSLPANAVDILDGKAKAADIAESMAIAYWMHGRDTETALYHLNAVHEQFADLAAALGYTIARAPTTYTAVDAAEPAEVEDREAYNLRVHGLREEDLP